MNEPPKLADRAFAVLALSHFDGDLFDSHVVAGQLHQRFNRISKPRLWIVTAEEAALCMQGVKISRECNSPKEDNRVDGAGYWEVLNLIVTERLKRGLPDPDELPDDIGEIKL